LKVNFGTGKNLGLPVGRFEVKIVDEDAKINVNLGASNDIAHIRLAKELMGLMSPPQYNPLFEQRDSTGNYHDRLTICAAIIDWADVDELAMNCDTQTQQAPVSSGVEDAYYQLLATKAYRRKNAPYDSLEELHLVRGITDDFWATFVDPDPTKPEKRVMTVWGQGAVNVNSANAQTLLGVVCAGAPTATICTDITQAGMFLSGVTMARAMTMGAPLFGTPNDFIQMMQGQGMLGPIFTGMGMKPVKFLSVAEFAKTITTESKVFSIYSVGIIKGYKREVRLRIQEVVDFRNTPNLSSVPSPSASGSATAPPPVPSSSAGSSSANAAALVQPATAGNVVYFRID
ncbi:MAG TPA: type II secretion system protein GspK, partial [Polyangiaceae bacterium]|nr:type II secretion system protein GspK [Polyangiaceae bacterium]